MRNVALPSSGKDTLSWWNKYCITDETTLTSDSISLLNMLMHDERVDSPASEPQHYYKVFPLCSLVGPPATPETFLLPSKMQEAATSGCDQPLTPPKHDLSNFTSSMPLTGSRPCIQNAPGLAPEDTEPFTPPPLICIS